MTEKDAWEAWFTTTDTDGTTLGLCDWSCWGHELYNSVFDTLGYEQAREMRARLALFRPRPDVSRYDYWWPYNLEGKTRNTARATAVGFLMAMAEDDE